MPSEPPAEESNENKDENKNEASSSSKASTSQANGNGSAVPQTNGTAKQKDTDPTHYELIIDNDSGTYRPNAEKLPLLKEYLLFNLPGLKVKTLDCQADADLQTALKKEQRDMKKAASGGKSVMYMQNMSMSSLSSSDEEDLDARAEAGEDGEVIHESRYKREMHKFMDGGKDQHHGEAEDEIQHEKVEEHGEVNGAEKGKEKVAKGDLNEKQQ
jgi:hypothetical protein